MFSCEFREISNNTFLKNISGWLLLNFVKLWWQNHLRRFKRMFEKIFRRKEERRSISENIKINSTLEIKSFILPINIWKNFDFVNHHCVVVVFCKLSLGLNFIEWMLLGKHESRVANSSIKDKMIKFLRICLL